jgi:hypothetical protein
MKFGGGRCYYFAELADLFAGRPVFVNAHHSIDGDIVFASNSGPQFLAVRREEGFVG